MTKFRLGWVAQSVDGTVYMEGGEKHFLEVAETVALDLLQLCEVDTSTETVTRAIATISIPEDKLPIFFRRSKLMVNDPTLPQDRVTCIGYRDKQTGEGSYTFVRPSGEIIVTQDAWGILPE